MIYTSLDLEMDQPGCEIIQIGAVSFDAVTMEVFEKLRAYVKIDHPLNPFITKLTGITDEVLQKEGTSLREAYDKLVLLHKARGAFVNPVTWGQGDSQCLRSQVGLDEAMYCFGRRSRDVKDIFQAWRESQGEKVQGGLAKSLTKLGMQFQGRKHDALDDAFNTARAYHALLRKFRA